MPICPECSVEYLDGTVVCPADGSHLAPYPASVAHEDLKRGARVGEYEIVQKLGAGGFGDVYMATHPMIGKKAAVKVLSKQYANDSEMMSRFLAEARVVNQIRHRNIVDIFSFGTLADGRQYFVMELLEGIALDKFLKRGPLSVQEALPIFRQIARAIDAAHAQGIVHRDLKPANIFLVPDDEGYAQAKILDFGLAKLMGEVPKTHKTRSGIAMGTACYMSPEQCHGNEIDYRTDIYAFGCIVYEVLTGSVPFDAPSYMAILMKHISDPPPHATALNPDLPTALDAPLLAMLAKDPSERPASLTAACDAIATSVNVTGPTAHPPKLEFVPTTSVPAAVILAARPSDRVTAAGDQATARHEKSTAKEGRGQRAGDNAETLVALSAPDATRANDAALAPHAPTPSHATRNTLIGLTALAALAGAGLYTAQPTSTPQIPTSKATSTVRALTLPTPTTPPTNTAQTLQTAMQPQPAPVTDAAVSDGEALSGNVNISFFSAPESAMVFDGDKSLGQATAGVVLPKSLTTVTLEVRAEGYRTKRVTLDLTRDQVVDARLLATYGP